MASAGTEIVPLTGRFGAAIIESRAENAIAAHALLELVAEHRTNADAALIAVSYDTGLLAARDIAGIPVLGITQASLSVACLLGSRIGMVTFGTPDLYRELAEGYGCGSRIVGIEVIATDARAAYADPGQVEDIVAAGALKLVSAGADVVVLCGAALSGMAAAIERTGARAGARRRDLRRTALRDAGPPGQVQPPPGAARRRINRPFARAAYGAVSLEGERARACHGA